MVSWHAKKEAEILKDLKSSNKGLANKEARSRLEEYGKNELVKIRKLNILKIFGRQFVSFLILILVIAAVISAILKSWIDFSVIMAIVVLNSCFGFFQEYKAERAIENLKSMLVPKAKVLRDDKVIEIDARDIVPGDILVLSEGDKIMSDARIISSENLEVNEAALTGESNPRAKSSKVLKIDTTLAERVNMIYLGTEVVRGNCKALVVDTGMKTEFGKVAELVQKVEPERNPLIEKINIFARKIGIVILTVIVLISAMGFVLGFDKLQIFLTAVSLAVSAIPEGLPAVITISLALATQRMLKVNSLIRKLPAAETLGRATIICTDKTGTITEEKMQVTKIFVNNKLTSRFSKDKGTEFLFKVGILCNNARIEYAANGLEDYYIGDPTEKALVQVARKYGFDKKQETEKLPRVKEYSFSSSRKMMAVVRQGKNEYLSYVKGAPEIILNRCRAEFSKGKTKELSDKRRKELLCEYEKMAAQGLRVLGFAYRTILKTNKITQEKAEEKLVFVGFQGMIDPPRPEVKKALKEAKDAGIKVLMITGDSAITARAVGLDVGLKGKIVEGEQLKSMSDDQLRKEIYDIAIFARVSPEDKLRLVNILKENKEIVAMTGDGVNDAPALKKADIGIAVNRGTDVAKDASEMVLLDNNFASIVKAVREGRRVYDNIKKFIKYMLSANTNEITLITFAIIIGLPLPLLPLQILWLNLITDSFPALAISTELPEKEVMRRKPRKNEDILHGVKLFIILAGFLAFVICLIAFWINIESLDKARTMALTTSVIFQMVLVFNARTSKSAFKSFNKYIVYAVGLSLLLHVLLIYTKLNVLFSLTLLGIIDWIMIIGMCTACFFILEFAKAKSKNI